MIPPELNETELRRHVGELVDMYRDAGMVVLVADTKPAFTSYTTSLQTSKHKPNHILVVVMLTEATSQLFTHMIEHNVMIASSAMCMFENVYDFHSACSVFWGVLRAIYLPRNTICPVCEDPLDRTPTQLLVDTVTRHQEAIENAQAMGKHASKIGKPFSKKDLVRAYRNSIDTTSWRNFPCPVCGLEVHGKCVSSAYSCNRCGLQVRETMSGMQVYCKDEEPFPKWMTDRTIPPKEKRALMQSHIKKISQQAYPS